MERKTPFHLDSTYIPSVFEVNPWQLTVFTLKYSGSMPQDFQRTPSMIGFQSLLLLPLVDHIRKNIHKHGFVSLRVSHVGRLVGVDVLKLSYRLLRL